ERQLELAFGIGGGDLARTFEVELELAAVALRGGALGIGIEAEIELPLRIVSGGLLRRLGGLGERELEFAVGVVDGARLLRLGRVLDLQAQVEIAAFLEGDTLVGGVVQIDAAG